MNNELTSELRSQIRFRCPTCQKLYCTDSASLASNPIEPSEFECFSCAEAFFLYPVKTENGLHRTEKTNLVEFSQCPKCNYLKPHKQDECSSCGVLESKYKEIQKLENPRLFELDQKWSEVLANLMNDQSHQNFLNLAQSHMALNFASQKYMDLKKNIGADPLIEKYLQQIELRLTAMIQTRFQAEKQLRSAEAAKKYSILGWLRTMSSKDIFKVVSLLGSGIFIFNKIHPLFPNLTGLIVAATTLSYGLWFISLNKNNI